MASPDEDAPAVQLKFDERFRRWQIVPAKMSPSATTELRVTGMTCNNCARKVTDAAQKIPGVSSVSVNLSVARASVRWNAGAEKNVAAILTAISQAGFAAKEISIEPSGDEAAQSRWQWNLIIGLGVTGALMIGEWIFGLAMTPWFQWCAFVLAGVVQVFCGAQFYAGAWRQIKVGQSNMDALVALGSTTAFGYSCWALFSGAGGHVYFMEAAAIISLISFGHWLEARVSDQASGALKSLLNLAPQTARKIVSPGGSRRTEAPSRFDLRHATFGISQSLLTSAAATEEEVPVSQLKIGDRIALRPGDRVPVDGVVLEGESAVDEAMLTGESIPADKKSGGELFAGTVNLNGRLVMRVTATGEATALAHIIAAVQRAQTSRADIQRLGDRISNVFVPVIVVLALAAGLWWGLAPAAANRVHDLLAQFFWHAHTPAGAAAGFIIAAAVLIVACPCAMGLATPAAIMASANAAARRGILIRDGVALEKAGKITAVIFDKTGTLTVGKPEVAAIGASSTDSACSESLPEARAARRCVRARRRAGANSTHPISQAIAKISAEKIELYGLAGNSRGGRGSEIQHPTSNIRQPMAKLRLGSLRWLQESGVDLAAGEKFIAEWSEQGATHCRPCSKKKLCWPVCRARRGETQRGESGGTASAAGIENFSGHRRQCSDRRRIAKQVGIAAGKCFCRSAAGTKSGVCEKTSSARASAWRSWATASTTRRRSRRPISASP